MYNKLRYLYFSLLYIKKFKGCVVKTGISSIVLVPYGGVSSADRSLTGSSTLLRVSYFSGKVYNLLVDVGSYQGTDQIHNNENFVICPSEIDVVLLTHNHTDHCGLLPKLYAEGFSGKVYTHKNAIPDLRFIFEDHLAIMETDIKIAIAQRKALAKRMRIALKNVSGKTKREVVSDVNKTRVEDVVIAYGFLQKYRINSKSDLKRFERAGFKQISSLKNLKGDKKRVEQKKLDQLVIDLDSALTLVREQQKVSVISKEESQLIVERNGLSSESDIKSKLPKVPDLIFDKTDIGTTISNIIGFEYNKSVNIAPGISICAYSAAHLPWSSQIVVNIQKEVGVASKRMMDSKRILFSGDLGQIRRFNLLGDLDFPLEHIDAALIENTYGDRNHQVTIEDDKDNLLKIYSKSLKKGGIIVIPVFANHRVHQVMYMIHSMIEEGTLPKEQTVYISSGLGQNLHKNRLKRNPYISGRFLINKNFRWVDSTFSVSNLSTKDGVVPIFLSSSGMMEGGSIMKQIKHFLPFKKNTLVSVCYMAEGTYGRQVFDGEKLIVVNSNPIEIHCELQKLGSFSGHADQNDLIFYQENIKFKKGGKIIYNHGDPLAVKSLMDRVVEEEINPELEHIKAELHKEVIIYKAQWALLIVLLIYTFILNFDAISLYPSLSNSFITDSQSIDVPSFVLICFFIQV